MISKKIINSRQYEKAKLFATTYIASMSSIEEQTSTSNDDMLNGAAESATNNGQSEGQTEFQVVILRKAKEKARRVGNDIHSLIEMAEMHYKKRWAMDFADLVILVSCLAYVVDPMDLIPDILPVAGYIDDAALVAFTVERLRENIIQFEAWKDEHIADYEQGKEDPCFEIGCVIL